MSDRPSGEPPVSVREAAGLTAGGHPAEAFSSVSLPGPTAQEPGPALSNSKAHVPGLLHELFEHQADIHPDATAVICGACRLTYREVEIRANRLAHHLRGLGVRRGDCVGILLPRSADVYVALLAVLKSGAAYVPIDPDYPADRVSYILSDSQAKALITVAALATQAGSCENKKVLLDQREAESSNQRADRFARSESRLTPADLCYVIYTSGTTGRPKGVQIEHRSAHHLVCAEAQVFHIRREDRVYQGFSIAFDASVEEIWLAFASGATLVVGTAEMVQAGPALSRTLAEVGVTVLSCVPTLLSMLDQDIPTVRLLILGGETCSQELVCRWWKPGRRMVNTYGPTEATVIATYAECHPDKPVTIGRPLAGYSAYILDEQLQPVPAGSSGELCLGGFGLARGYLGRDDLTREKFISVSAGIEDPQRLYRTGDLARWNLEGEIDFLGRIDSQVKVRGFRVELSEIESVLMTCDGVKAAAAALREDVPGTQQLVAYVVPERGANPSEVNLRGQLRERLPVFMIPSLVELISELPVLPSGKTDRNALPAPRPRAEVPERKLDTASTPLEGRLVAVWEKFLTPARISTSDDFFMDLGGHSLLAARMVSELRMDPVFGTVSMADIYRHPTVQKLAAELERRGEVENAEKKAQDTQIQAEPAANRSRRTNSIPFWRHFWCGAAQAVSLVFVLTFFALQWLTPYLTYTLLVEEEYGLVTAILGAFASLIAFYPVMVTVPILLKWILIGRYRPGRHPLWGFYYFRWWLATTVEAAVPIGYLSGTPLLNIYFRLMGAKIGRNVQLHSDNCVIYDLVTIGDDSSINIDSRLLGYTVEGGFLKIGSISIGHRCFVGTRAALCPDTVMQDDSALEDLSLLPSGATIHASETWGGSPAGRMPNPERTGGTASGAAPAPTDGGTTPADVAPGNQQPGNRLVFGLLHAIGVLVFPVLVVAALFPGIVVMNKLNYIDPYYWYLFLAPLAGLSFVLLLALEIAAIKWLILGKVKPCTYPVRSGYYLRKWFVDQTIELSLDVLGPLYASIYLAPWYQLLGAKLGSGAEVSTASFISPDLLSIGDESFVADSVSLGAPRVRNGRVTIGRNQIGRRSFIGNSAMLPPATAIGDSVLIGCLSLPPANPGDALREDTAWLGSPAMFLPQRQKSSLFSEETTFRPSNKLRVLRATIEFVRVISPSTFFIILLSLLFSVLLLLRDEFSFLQTLLFFPPLYIACALTAGLITIVAKWLLVWRYRPGEKPLWSTFVWRNELLNALHEHLAEPFIVGALTGTPFICWYFRLLGSRIGQRVYMETADLSEFDLAYVDDEATLNADCTIQTHLFEDRVMKLSDVTIGRNCTVGGGSLVLYDTRMEAGSTLGDLSLLMKGETLPAGTTWQGIPAQRR
jgi:non-ribosomal peptide synthetase-like protein